MSELFDSDPRVTLVPPADGETHTDAEIENARERGEISRAEARQLSVGERIIEHETEIPTSLTQPSTPERQLELVTPEHIPRKGVRREPKLRKPREARSWRERLVGDQPPDSQRVTPLGHDPVLVVHQGGHRAKRA